MSFLQILALLLILIGAVFNYGASFIVSRWKLDQRVKINEASELPAEEWLSYGVTKAKAMVKMVGFAFLLPGVLLVFFTF